MAIRSRSAATACLRLALACLACIALSGCAPMLIDVLQRDPRDPDRYVRAHAAELVGAATVYRGGRALPLRLPHQLQPGDVIQTAPDAVARIRYPEGHQIILDGNTRARLGSFFIEFGRILARVRGVFEAESENVLAGVEGTEFVFQVPGDGSAFVTVLDGAVVCRSRMQRWAPVHLRGGERFQLFANAPLPEKHIATPDELDDIGHWIRQIEGGVPAWPVPAREGFCCADGRVFETSRERCRGRFFLDRGAADGACRPPPESGYCCRDGEVDRSSRERCRGRFFFEQAEAERACPIDRRGYCCDDGRVFETSRDRCKGGFHRERAEAERACQTDRRGYCCDDGRVFESSREQCGGRFFPDRGSADKQCTPPPGPGYCCSDGEVMQSTRERCKGSFHRDRAEANAACRRPHIDPRRALPRLRTPPYEIVPPREPAAPPIR